MNIMTSKLSKAILTIGVCLLISVVGALANDDANIKVVYPKLNQRIGAIDSTFIFGSVNPDWRLTVNGHATSAHKDGGWIAFLPLQPGEFVFSIVATNGKDSSVIEWPVYVPGILIDGEMDSLVIFNDYRLPTDSRSLATGDILHFQFRGAPGCRAWGEIVGVADSIPMLETATIPQPYHAGDVFDGESSQIDSSFLVPGVYQGLYNFTSALIQDSAVVVIHLAAPDLFMSLSGGRDDFSSASILGVDLGVLKKVDWRLANYADSVVTDTMSITLSLNLDEYPRTVEFTDTTQRLRVAPSRGYLGIFQPAGVRALAVGFEGDWFRLQLSESRVGYVEMSAAEALPTGILPPRSQLSSFRCEAEERELTISAQLSGKHPFSISEPDATTMIVELFGVTMDTDWFRFDFGDTMLTAATWTQPEPELFRLELRFSLPIWGYHAGYRGNSFELTIKHPPDDIHSLRGKVIVVDPGHKPDPGSIGPTGLTEAEANLAIALILRDELKRSGAKVVMTREGDEGLELYGRPKVADSVDADLFVSVHNNALPDGTSPFVNYGVSSYFYHTHSQALARTIHQKMVALPNQKDHGFYHGNLAVLRPTERPSVLIECGFMILPEQEAWLKTKSYRRRVAHAIAQGIEEFLKNYSHKSDRRN
jgi:N-acetylmuramoyl-L-alanine amidase